MRFLFLILVLTNGIIEPQAEETGLLYSEDDPIAQLSASNFSQMILNQDHYWIIEFYNRWCGHCVRFAPYWKEFARDVEDWKKMVKVAVVHCADLINVEFCRKYHVTSFPSIKVFGVQAKETDQGIHISPEHSVEHIRRELIRILKNDCKDDLIPTWPYLCPVRSKSLAEFWQQVTSDSVLVIVDPPSSYIGEEVILDLSGRTHLPLLKVASNENLGRDLSKLTDLSSLPILLRINRDGKVATLARKENEHENMRAKFVHVIDPKKTIVVVSSASPDDDEVVTRVPIRKISPVYMQDLENALNYSLRQEVGVHDRLKGEKLDALKEYVKALKDYFPGRAVVMRFLHKLFDWLMEQGTEVHVKDMINKMKEMQNEEAYLPPRSQWKGCKGSKPGLRGYPCSLWTLFHTLTVQAYLKYRQGAIAGDPQNVLFAVKGYVKNFFSCGECSEHFQQMAENLENELVNPEDGVLWLWRAHNKVNKRLALDMSTNDPLHPKVQFPPKAVCPKCRHKERTTAENVSWSINNVLKFLLSFYSKEQIIMESDNSLISIRDEESEKFLQVKSFKSSASFSEQPLGTWRFRYFNGTDISLCVMLYIVSAVLLTIIYFLFTLRRQRHKMRQFKHFTAYP